MKSSVESYQTAAKDFVKEFPYQLPQIVAYIHQCFFLQVQNRAELEMHWPIEIITPVEWFYCASTVNQIIESWEIDPTPRDFVKELFYGHRALFSADCILRYAATPECPPEMSRKIEYLFK